MNERPRLRVEDAIDGKISWSGIPRVPHCEPRILHHPDECEICAMPESASLHEERERLGVNYTGHTDRPFPCPGEKARSLKGINKWHGNTPKPKGYYDQD